MPSPKATKPAPTLPELPTAAALVEQLRGMASKTHRDGMTRFGITGEIASRAFGIPVGDIRELAKQLKGKGKAARDPERRAGRHARALELWNTGIYEAQLLAAFIDDPALVTPAQMDAWAKTFDNWATCDTACFHLFDKPPLCEAPARLAYRKVEQWAARKEEFVRRAGFALLASLALHDKKSEDAVFVEFFPLISRHAHDPRNFVKKAVSWALRGIGKRNPALRRAATKLAQSMAESTDAPTRWIGKDALRDLR